MAMVLTVIMYLVYGFSVAAAGYSAYSIGRPPASETRRSAVFWLCGAIFLVIAGSAFLRQAVSWEPLYLSSSVALAALGAGLAPRQSKDAES